MRWLNLNTTRKINQATCREVETGQWNVRMRVRKKQILRFCQISQVAFYTARDSCAIVSIENRQLNALSVPHSIIYRYKTQINILCAGRDVHSRSSITIPFLLNTSCIQDLEALKSVYGGLTHLANSRIYVFSTL